MECVTISAPKSIGLQCIGVAKVLSTINGILFLCATFANFSISKTDSDGFAIVSPNIAFVFPLISCCISFSDTFGDINVKSIPIFFIVVENRLNVPPYICEDAKTWSPAFTILKTAIKLAACPDDVSMPETPPSKSAIFAATISFVGFCNLE